MSHDVFDNVIMEIRTACSAERFCQLHNAIDVICYKSVADCNGAYLGIGMLSVRGSAENDHAMAHLDVRPCKTVNHVSCTYRQQV